MEFLVPINGICLSRQLMRMLFCSKIKWLSLFMVLVPLLAGCPFQWGVAVQQQDSASGIVKFFRSDDEKYPAEFQVYLRRYGKEEFVGRVYSPSEYLCMAVHPGMNVFKVFAPGGKHVQKIINVKEGQIHPVELSVSWSKGYRFDNHVFYRWKVSTESARAPEDGECGQRVVPEEPEVQSEESLGQTPGEQPAESGEPAVETPESQPSPDLTTPLPPAQEEAPEDEDEEDEEEQEEEAEEE